MCRADRGIKAALTEMRNERWSTQLDSLEPKDNSLWRVSKALLNKKQTTAAIHEQRGVAYSDDTKADTFADTLEDQFELPSRRRRESLT